LAIWRVLCFLETSVLVESLGISSNFGAENRHIAELQNDMVRSNFYPYIGLIFKLICPLLHFYFIIVPKKSLYGHFSCKQIGIISIPTERTKNGYFIV
jgi:hypothetical protein